ncbi:MAG: hypothetical protein WDZ49_05770 [Litorilinea sp.]
MTQPNPSASPGNAPNQVPTSVLYYGTTAPLPEAHTLRAGPLSLQFAEGDLRYIRLGEHELLRRVYVAVRDQNWNTIPGRIQDLVIETREEAFAITFTMIHHEDDIHFTWEGEIRGRPAGEITFTMHGQVLSRFLRNRIGICVLHPAGCAGLPCRVEHVARGEEDDEQAVDALSGEESCFPQQISPHQPFMNIRAITHEITTDGDETIEAEVRFDGDIFEMEDQRNWTDASFKTYSTPLAIPYPVQANVGEIIHQEITLKALGSPARLEAIAARGATANGDAHPSERTAPDILSLASQPTGNLPRVGLCRADHGEELSMTEISRLRALAPAHLRVELYPQSRAFVGVLAAAWREAAFLGAQLEVALFLSGDAARAAEQLGYVARAVGEFNPDISHWLIFHQEEASTTAPWLEQARDILKTITPQARFIAGTNAYFTDLNRNRPPVAVADGISFTINPQVHAFDNQSLVETLETQATTVTSAAHFAGDLPIYVSSVTLRPRFNPNATGSEPDPAPDTLPDAVDPRQMSLFGAAWTLGSVKYLAQGGAASVTYYATTGWQGVMERAGGSPLPTAFRSLPGAVFPLYHILADIAEFSDGTCTPLATRNNLAVDGLALHAADGRTSILVANLTAQPRQVELRAIMGNEVAVRRLDETNAIWAMQEPEQYRQAPPMRQPVRDATVTLDLLPYASARLDVIAANQNPES